MRSNIFLNKSWGYILNSSVLTTYHRQKEIKGWHHQAPNVKGTPIRERDLHDIELDDLQSQIQQL